MKKQVILLSALFVIVTCKTDKKKAPVAETTEMPKPGIVHVKTQSMEFYAPDTLQSGWNTFFYENASTEAHFLLLDLYPEGKTAADTKNDILPPFEQGMRLIMEGDIENAVAAFGKLPPWFQEVRYMGGTGLISPKQTAKSTVYLEPGTYIMECYVKMFNGEWHTSHGMYKQITVTDKVTGMNPPQPTIRVDVSSTKGIVLKDSISAGKQMFEVNFMDQKLYEHFLGHDVNLVKYDATASLDSLVRWMNWMNPRGLCTPSPEGFTFLGGMNNLPSDGKGFFEADLKPGNYVLIAEVPDSRAKKLFRLFEIAP